MRFFIFFYIFIEIYRCINIKQIAQNTLRFVQNLQATNPFLDEQKDFVNKLEHENLRSPINDIKINQQKPLEIGRSSMLLPLTEEDSISFFIGLLIGDPSSQYELEAFYDLLGESSQLSFNALIHTIKEFYLNKTTHQPEFRLRVNIFPQPHHKYSYLVTLGQAFMRRFGKKVDEKYIQLIFDNRLLFQNEVTRNKSPLQVQDDLIDLIITSFNKTEIFKELNADELKKAFGGEKLNSKVQISMEYAQRKKVFSTPMYFQNQVYLEDAEDFEEDEWEDYLEQFMVKYEPEDITMQPQVDQQQNVVIENGQEKIIALH